jgi:hypothetical protein
VYLVAREPGAMHYPTLLGSAGGVAAYHEDSDRWLRAPPPPVPSRALREAWRQWESPAGGVVRYGLAHRRRWIAALQLSRLEPAVAFARVSSSSSTGRRQPWPGRSRSA